MLRALTDPAQGVRSAAAAAFTEIRDPRAVEPLVQALRDPHHWVRSTAASALSEQHDARAVLPLIALLADPNAEVRQTAIDALDALGDTRAIPHLEWLQEHDTGVTQDGKVCNSARGVAQHLRQRATFPPE